MDIMSRQSGHCPWIPLTLLMPMNDIRGISIDNVHALPGHCLWTKPTPSFQYSSWTMSRDSMDILQTDAWLAEPEGCSYFLLTLSHQMRGVMGKPAFCICENKDADQLRGNHEADQSLCFHYMDSTISLLPKSKIFSFQPSSVAVQPGLCRTWSETRRHVFSRQGSNNST